MAVQPYASTRPAPASQYSMTYHDLDTLPDYITRYELWEGELRMSPSPTSEHQMLSMRLTLTFGTFDPDFERGLFFYSPLDVVLRENVVVQPDFFFVVKSRREIVQEKRVMGPPDLCIEILSPKTSAYDLSRKRRYYEEAGVREYWLLDSVAQALTVYGLAAGITTEYRPGRMAVSTLPELEGLQVDIARLFAPF